MKASKYIYVLFAMLLVTATAWGQETIPTTGTKNLTGNVNLSKMLTLTGNLTIKNTGTGPITIKNTASKPSDKDYTLVAMFEVPDGKTLTIDGGEHGIIIDGGAVFNYPANFPQSIDIDNPQGISTGSGHKKLDRGCIRSYGSVVLKNVTLQNGDFTYNHGGLLRLLGPSGKTTIDNCTFKRARSHQGCGISVNSNEEVPTNEQTIAITISNSTFKECYLLKYPDDKDQSGAVVRFNGSWCGNLKMTNCIMENNFEAGDINCLQWNAIGNGTLTPECQLDGCEFRNNVTAGDCSAILIEGTLTFVNNVTKVYNNRAGGYAGGILAHGYAGGIKLKLRKDPIVYNMNDKLWVHNNQAGMYGGGIVFLFTDACRLPKKSVIHAKLNGAKVYNNTAQTEGGGVYVSNRTRNDSLYTFVVRLDKGEVYKNSAGNAGGGAYVSQSEVSVGLSSTEKLVVRENTAPNGGGICISEGTDKTKVTKLTVTDVSVESNEATNGNGGGIYMTGGNIDIVQGSFYRNEAKRTSSTDDEKGNGGGVALFGGNFTVTGQADISNNNAANGGGGIYVQNGAVAIKEGDISYNNCKNMGGGLFVYNGTSGRKNLVFDGGTFSHNGANSGGGIAISGALDLTLSATVENNFATNGGGLYVADGAKVTFDDGLIRANKANRDSKEVSFGKTAFGKSVSEVHGIGGGVYLDNNTHFEFNTKAEFGIYNNLADNAADDIYASGTGTEMVLPDVLNMQLKDFDVPTDKLFWIEDYMNADEMYHDKGTNINKTGDSYRYRSALTNMSKDIYPLGGFEDGNTDLSAYTKNYLCLTLSYELVYLTFIKKGLDNGDDAAFILSYPKKNEDGSTTYIEYDRFLLIGNGQDVKKTIVLPEGKWRFEESKWSWKYDENPDFEPARDSDKCIDVARDPENGVNTVIVTNKYKPTIDKVDIRDFDFHKVNRIKP